MKSVSMDMSMRLYQPEQRKCSARHAAALSLLLGLLWPVYVHAQQVNDLTQMDNANAGKLYPSQQKPEGSPRPVPKLRAEDNKKYQAVITGMEGKHGDEILKTMQADNA